jgi:hypothetical protein
VNEHLGHATLRSSVHRCDYSTPTRARTYKLRRCRVAPTPTAFVQPRQMSQWAQELTFTSSSELNDFLNGDVAKHGRQEQGSRRRYYAARRWMLAAASRITSYTRRGWDSIGT